MARKTPKPKVQSYQKILRENDPSGVYAVLDHCLDTYRKDLKAESCRIALAWRYGLKRSKDGQLVLGKCVKVSELHKEYATYDFVIVLNAEAWRTLDDAQRTALMHHELCHAAIAEDQNGNVKKDAKNRTCFRVRKHDVEEFGDVINAHGCYKQDLENFVATAMRSKKPPSPSLIDGVLEQENAIAGRVVDHIEANKDAIAAELQKNMPEGVTVELQTSAARKTPERPPVKSRRKARP